MHCFPFRSDINETDEMRSKVDHGFWKAQVWRDGYCGYAGSSTDLTCISSMQFVRKQIAGAATNVDIETNYSRDEVSQKLQRHVINNGSDLDT
ncbi:unnamed protein product [Diplocarpon coronariae]